MSLTNIAEKLFFRARQHELERHFNDAEAMQAEVLDYLVARGKTRSMDETISSVR